MPLTVLSALSRLDIDPWKEAAELSELPKDTAAQRLASLVARLPGGRWAADAMAIADRLIELLPRRGHSSVQSGKKAHSLQQMTGSPVVLICAALALVAFIIATSCQRSTRSDDTGAPTFSTTSPPQTSGPSSR